MRDAIQDLIHVLWPLLPEITIMLRFCSALIVLGLAVGTATRRIRRRIRVQRKTDSPVQGNTRTEDEPSREAAQRRTPDHSP